MGAATVDENGTQLIPYGAEETMWARTRPPDQRVPTPQPSDTVYYRHDPWGPLMFATVDEVLDDPADPRVGGHNPDVWEVQRDQVTGKYLVVMGKQLIVRKPDPWPQLRLLTRPRTMVIVTQEARLRGSPGWLPLDWETRYRPTPGFIEAKGGHR